jgi:hypothetical protein
LNFCGKKTLREYFKKFSFQGQDALRVETICRQVINDHNPDVRLAAAADEIEKLLREEAAMASAADEVEKRLRDDDAREEATMAAAPEEVEEGLRDCDVDDDNIEVREDFDDQRPEIAEENAADVVVEDVEFQPQADVEHDQPKRIHYDEATAFFNMRFVGSMEASWRLLGFGMFYSNYSVVQLAIHDENDASVTFRRGNEQNALDHRKLSTLEAFMELNAGEHREFASRFLYMEWPEHFTRDSK